MKLYIADLMGVYTSLVMSAFNYSSKNAGIPIEQVSLKVQDIQQYIDGETPTGADPDIRSVPALDVTMWLVKRGYLVADDTVPSFEIGKPVSWKLSHPGIVLSKIMQVYADASEAQFTSPDEVAFDANYIIKIAGNTNFVRKLILENILEKESNT